MKARLPRISGFDTPPVYAAPDVRKAKRNDPKMSVLHRLRLNFSCSTRRDPRQLSPWAACQTQADLLHKPCGRDSALGHTDPLKPRYRGLHRGSGCQTHHPRYPEGMPRPATYDDVNLVLRMYEPRREKRMRAARVGFGNEFSAKTFEEATPLRRRDRPFFEFRYATLAAPVRG